MAWLAPLGYSLREFARRHGVRLVLVLVLSYFGYHAVHGDRGLVAWMDNSRLVEQRRIELASLQEKRRGLEHQVEALHTDRMSRDLLEEELKKLGYIGDNEVIILLPGEDSEDPSSLE